MTTFRAPRAPLSVRRGRLLSLLPCVTFLTLCYGSAYYFPSSFWLIRVNILVLIASVALTVAIRFAREFRLWKKLRRELQAGLVRCIQCDYRLQGLGLSTHHCPECAYPVQRSKVIIQSFRPSLFGMSYYGEFEVPGTESDRVVTTFWEFRSPPIVQRWRAVFSIVPFGLFAFALAIGFGGDRNHHFTWPDGYLIPVWSGLMVVAFVIWELRFFLSLRREAKRGGCLCYHCNARIADLSLDRCEQCNYPVKWSMAVLRDWRPMMCWTYGKFECRLSEEDARDKTKSPSSRKQ